MLPCDVMQKGSIPRGSGGAHLVNELSCACERLGPDPRRGLGPELIAEVGGGTGRTIPLAELALGHSHSSSLIVRGEASRDRNDCGSFCRTN